MHISGGFPKLKPKKPQPSGITVEGERRKQRRRKVEESAGWLNTGEGSVLTHSEDEYPFTPWQQEFPRYGEEDEDESNSSNNEDASDSSNDDYRKRKVKTFSVGPVISHTGSAEQAVEKVEPPSVSPTDVGKTPPIAPHATSEVPGFYFTDCYEGEIRSGRYLSKSAIEGQMNFEFAVTGRRRFDIVQILGDGTRVYVHYEYDGTGHLHATRQLQVVREYPETESTDDSGSDSYESEPEQQPTTDEPAPSGNGYPDGDGAAQPVQEIETWDGNGHYVILNPGTEDEDYVFFNSEEEKQEYINSLEHQGWTREEPQQEDDSSSGDDWESTVWGEDGSLAEGWDDIPEADDSFWSESGLG